MAPIKFDTYETAVTEAELSQETGLVIQNYFALSRRSRPRYIKAFRRERRDEMALEVRKTIEKQLLWWLKAELTYRHRADRWEFGEQRTLISVVRMLFSISPSCEVSQADAHNYRIMLNRFERDLPALTTLELQQIVKGAYFKLGEYRLSIDDDGQLNKLFKQLGKPSYYYHYSTSNGEHNYIFGLLNIKYKFKCIGDKYKINYLLEEWIRAPHWTLSLAATNFNKSRMAILRACSLETIYYNKWISFGETTDFEAELLYMFNYDRCREKIKGYYFMHLGRRKITRQELVGKHQSIFLETCANMVARHEFGHFNDRVERAKTYDCPITGAIGQYSRIDPLYGIDEVIADLEVLCHIVELAESGDTKYATALLWIQISDYWFFEDNTDLGHMGHVALVALLVYLCYFGNKPYSVDFKKMKKDLETGRLKRYFIERRASLTAKYSEYILSSEVELPDEPDNVARPRTFDIARIEERLVRLYKRNAGKKAKGEFQLIDSAKRTFNVPRARQWSIHWSNLCEIIKQNTPDKYAQFEKMLSSDLDALLSDMLREFWGITVSEKKSRRFAIRLLFNKVDSYAPTKGQYTDFYRRFR